MSIIALFLLFAIKMEPRDAFQLEYAKPPIPDIIRNTL